MGIAADRELRPFALHAEFAVEAAAGVGQPITERCDRELDRGIGLVAAAAGDFDVALARGERERAVDDVIGLELQVGVAGNRPLAQRAAELVELDRRVRAAARSSCRRWRDRNRARRAIPERMRRDRTCSLSR